MRKNQIIVRDILKELKPFVEDRSHFELRSGKSYSACLRASFVRSFEFAEVSFKSRRSDVEYFLAPALRGIVEDVIFLRFLASVANSDRETIITNMLRLEIASGLERQRDFFGLFRPFQPVLGKGISDQTDLKNQVRDTFKRIGWPNLRTVTPRTIELARKCEPGVLEVVYEFIFRLTSGLVHFSPQILLKSGWGQSKSSITFSTKNMNQYYKNIAQIYGSFIFILYFEFFGRFLRPGPNVKELVDQLRDNLLKIFRWPEMVTFEEMNQPVPQPDQFTTMIMFSMYAVMQKDGFINGAGSVVYKK